MHGDRVRPTSDRVKESLFSILRNRIADADVLDLCAGSGNIGIEALSRDASSVTFVDHSGKSINLIKQNLTKCNLQPRSPQVMIIRKSAIRAIEIFAKKGKKFDLIYFDPPYDSEIYIEVLHELDKNELSADDGLIIVEHSRDEKLPASIGRLSLKDIREYGNTTLSFYIVDVRQTVSLSC